MLLKRSRWRLLGLGLAVASLVVPGGTGRAGPLDGFSSPNVEFIRNIPPPTAGGGHLQGDYFYVLGPGSLRIYDVSSPQDPQLVSSTALGKWILGWEDPDTNGEVMVVYVEAYLGADLGRLLVLDVRDKEHPAVIGQLPGVDSGSRTYTCILDCRWVYGATGHVIDLREPSRPRLLSRKWDEGLPMHNPIGCCYTDGGAPVRSVGPNDVTEIGPGIVLTGSIPIYLLDARRNPARPRVMARSDGSPFSWGGAFWPDWPVGERVVSFGGGIYGPRCEVRDHAAAGTSYDSGVKTWDASSWKGDHLLTGLDTYLVENGTYVDGNPAVSGANPGFWGCGAGWLDIHPDFATTPLIVESSLGHGTKFLRVAPNGDIREVGHFLGHGTDAVAAYWITDRIVYTLDYNRGIDILRFRRDLTR